MEILFIVSVVAYLVLVVALRLSCYWFAWHRKIRSRFLWTILPFELERLVVRTRRDENPAAAGLLSRYVRFAAACFAGLLILIIEYLLIVK